MVKYITSGKTIVAQVETELKPRTAVRWSRATCEEAINANYDKTLVNAKSGVISSGKKWDVQWAKNQAPEFASALRGQPYDFEVR